MISFHVPASHVPGAFRPAKFAKYLPEFGWEPVVLSAFQPPHSPVHRNVQNDSPESSQIAGTKPWMPAFRGKDRLHGLLPYWANGISWYFPALQAGLRLAARQEFDLIWATTPPPVALMVGRALKAKLGIPLVVDYRDPWSLSAYKPQSKLNDWLDLLVERRVLKQADRIVVTTPEIGEHLIRISQSQIHPAVIYNGVDLADFSSIQAVVHPGTIAHIGSIYGQRIGVAIRFFDALLTLEQENPALSTSLAVRFIGAVDKSVALSARRLNRVRVEFVESVTHLEAIQAMKETQLLLLINEPIEVTSLPSKVFEYLASARPILSLGAESGKIGILLRDFPDCVHIEPQPAQINRSLQFLLSQTAVDSGKRSTFLHQYDRKELTRQLATLFDTFSPRPVSRA